MLMLRWIHSPTQVSQQPLRHVLMGVPVLTMKGHNFNSRCGESININLEMENFIAENKDDYFNKAMSFQKEKNCNTEI